MSLIRNRRGFLGALFSALLALALFDSGAATAPQVKQIKYWEDHVQQHYPDYVFKIAQFWHTMHVCFNIKVLPDELTKAGVSWKYYGDKDVIYNAMQAIRHVRFGPEWKKVVPPELQLPEPPEVTPWAWPPLIHDPPESPGSAQAFVLVSPVTVPSG